MSAPAPAKKGQDPYGRIPSDSKVLVHFRPTGDAPILKKTKFNVSGTFTFNVIIQFLRKQLRYKPEESLFLFCNSSFSPSPDACIYDLYAAFQLEGELVINYCTTSAWG